MTNARYGIKVPFDGDELWVLGTDGRPLLFDSEQQAAAAAVNWMSYRIVVYEGSNED